MQQHGWTLKVRHKGTDTEGQILCDSTSLRDLDQASSQGHRRRGGKEGGGEKEKKKEEKEEGEGEGETRQAINNPS